VWPLNLTVGKLPTIPGGGVHSLTVFCSLFFYYVTDFQLHSFSRLSWRLSRQHMNAFVLWCFWLQILLRIIYISASSESCVSVDLMIFDWSDFLLDRFDLEINACTLLHTAGQGIGPEDLILSLFSGGWWEQTISCPPNPQKLSQKCGHPDSTLSLPSSFS